MQRLILVRHGQTDYNLERRFQGQIDIPLNETGERQAQFLGESAADSGRRLAAVYSSPLSRARETARQIALPFGLKVIEDRRFLERSFGEWEGHTREEIQAAWPEEFASWIGGHPTSGTGVEARAEVAQRFADACREYLSAHPDGDVVVVSHGAAISLGITQMLGLDPESFRELRGMNNCHCAVLIPQEESVSGAFMRLVSLNVGPNFPAE